MYFTLVAEETETWLDKQENYVYLYMKNPLLYKAFRRDAKELHFK